MKLNFIKIIILFHLNFIGEISQADCFVTLSNLSRSSKKAKAEIAETQKSKLELRQRTDRLTNLPGMWGNSWSDYDLRKMKYRENQLFEAELQLQTERLTNKMNQIQRKTENQSCTEATIGHRG